MNRLLYGSALCTLGLLCFTPYDAHAACVTDGSAGQSNATNPVYTVRFGAQVEAFAQSDSGECVDYVTDIDGWPTDKLTGETSDSYNAISVTQKTYGVPPNDYQVDVKALGGASASIQSGTVSASLYEYGDTLGALASNNAEWVDLVFIENLTAGLTDINYIPVTFCSELQSPYTTIGSNKSSVAYGDFNYGTDNKAGDSLTWVGTTPYSN